MANRTPLFLAKSGYRSRRLSDAARLLPVLGMFLLILPGFWASGPDGASMAEVGTYLFLVWAGLILGAWALSRKLSRRDPGDLLGKDDPGPPTTIGPP